MGGEGDDLVVNRSGAEGYGASNPQCLVKLHAGRLLVVSKAPRFGHNDRGVASKVAHDDAARARVAEGLNGLEPQRLRDDDCKVLAW